jgi:ppGpp synthetase/RelA/SpoT-type nucleotidyltranferase
VSPTTQFSDWHRDQIDAYSDHEFAIYKTYAEIVHGVLQQACNRHARLAIVQSRPKSVSSFAEKAARRWPALKDPIHQLTDLCGARVITHTQAGAERMCEFVYGNFHIVEAEDVSSRLRSAEFGYVSFHYIVQLREEVLRGVRLPPKLGDTATLLETIGTRKAEIQIRTLLQHAWADVMHDRLYKTKVAVPDAWRHEAARQAALLENADREFARIVRELDAFLVHHDAYMTAEQMDEEIETLSTILENEPEESNKAGVALRIARVARARNAWQTVIDHLRPYAEEIDTPDTDLKQAILLEFGRALSQAYQHQIDSAEYREGQRYIDRVARSDEIQLDDLAALRIKPDKLRADALCLQAESLKQQHGFDHQLRERLQMATAYDPENPYHLISSMEHEVLWHHDFKILRPHTPQIRAAIETCRAHVQLRIELPRAHFALGKCNVFMQRYYESLAAYAKAVQLSADAQPIEEEIQSVTRLAKTLENPPGELDWIVRFLMLARAGKLIQLAEARTTEWKLGATQAEDARRALVQVKGREQASRGELESATATAEKAARVESKAKTAAEEAERRAREVCEDSQLANLRTRECEGFREPVLIVAGGTDPAIQVLMETYKSHLGEAFQGFEGTVISGGTTAGISGIVGELAEREPGMIAIAYLAQQLPIDGPLDERYSHHFKTDGQSFSALEPLQNWIDLITSGIRPSAVRLLGINGGRIAAFEYQLALALGATVGLLESSGRAATDLLPDAGFWPRGRLLRLPDDVMTIRAFVNPARSTLPEQQLDEAARVAHEVYAEESLRKQANAPLRSWEHLPPDFQESSRQQVVYAAEILSKIGYCVGDLTSQTAEPDFTDEEVEIMAEMEHGRWVVERLKAGWRLGEKKDEEQKISPYLIPWDRLPENVKDYDRQAVKNYPRVLRRAGLGVYEREE